MVGAAGFEPTTPCPPDNFRAISGHFRQVQDVSIPLQAKGFCCSYRFTGVQAISVFCTPVAPPDQPLVMPTEALTAALVDRLRRAPPRTPGRVEHWDSKTPGLCLRISATGAATWTFRYRPRNGGGYQRVTLGAPPAVGLADAREHAARLRGEMAGGSDPQRDRMARRAAAANAFTFDRLAQRYLDEYAKPRKASWRNDEIFLKRPRQAWGKRDAATITRSIAGSIPARSTATVSAARPGPTSFFPSRMTAPDACRGWL